MSWGPVEDEGMRCEGKDWHCVNTRPPWNYNGLNCSSYTWPFTDPCGHPEQINRNIFNINNQLVCTFLISVIVIGCVMDTFYTVGKRKNI